MGFSALRVFEPKCQELQWSRVLAVDVAAFYEGRLILVDGRRQILRLEESCQTRNTETYTINKGTYE